MDIDIDESILFLIGIKIQIESGRGNGKNY